MDASGESGGSALEEKFPRIAQTLCACWGKADCTAYLESLIYDQRGGRQGFPADVGAELLMLHGLLEIQIGGDVWTQSDQRI